jgi:ribosomal protein S18 acetylase RimI-like enzyme
VVSINTSGKIGSVVSVAGELRPVNLRTDLAALADLIELAFAHSMDSGGRAVLREMRTLSKLGPGLNLLSRMSDSVTGVSLGYVWLVNGRLVGNVSVYRAKWPSDLGNVWLIANVAVHPDYRQQGIAYQLMQAAMKMVVHRGGNAAILQVETENEAARHLYRSLGFTSGSSWTVWRRRGTMLRQPKPSEEGLKVSRRHRGKWRDEFALAGRIRLHDQDGLGWLRPLHESQFKRTLTQKLSDWVNLNKIERHTVWSEKDDKLLASLWIEAPFSRKTYLTLMTEPHFRGLGSDILLNLAVRRFGNSPLFIEHPSDDAQTEELLLRYQFKKQRILMPMRWDVSKT